MSLATGSRLAVLAAVAVFPFAALWSAPAAAQDFDCRTPKLVAEQVICASAKLSGMDERMARLYGRLWSKLDNDNREGLRDYQLAFLHTRNMCNRNAKCIEDAYADQISVLEQRLAQEPRQHRHHAGWRRGAKS